MISGLGDLAMWCPYQDSKCQRWGRFQEEDEEAGLWWAPFEVPMGWAFYISLGAIGTPSPGRAWVMAVVGLKEVNNSGNKHAMPSIQIFDQTYLSLFSLKSFYFLRPSCLPNIKTNDGSRHWWASLYIHPFIHLLIHSGVMSSMH